MKYLKIKFLLVVLILLNIQSAQNCMALDQMTLKEVKNAYPIWYQNFKSDYQNLVKKLQENKSAQTISKSEINEIFKNSVSSDSTMTEMILQLVQKGGTHDQMTSDFMINSPGTLLIGLLEGASPVALGGFFEKQNGWAIYIKVKDEFSEYNPYAKNKVPQNGKLVRDSYPFITFEEKNGKLMIRSLSKEFGAILDKLSVAQYT